MVFSALGLILSGRQFEFPIAPIRSEFEQGRQAALKGQPIDRIMDQSMRPMGYWFDGRMRQPVDYSLWLSPSFASRWLGWLAEKGRWPSDLTAARWGRIRDALNHRITFVVQICAYPKLDPLGFGTGKKADPSELRPYFSGEIEGPKDYRNPLPSDIWHPKGEVYQSEHRTGTLIWSRESYHWRDLSGRKFYEGTILESLFSPSGLQKDSDPLLPLGPYYSAEWLVQFPISNAPSFWRSFTLKADMPGKLESAKFASN